MELPLKEQVRMDHVKKGERCSRQVDQKKSKLVGAVQHMVKVGRSSHRGEERSISQEVC